MWKWWAKEQFLLMQLTTQLHETIRELFLQQSFPHKLG